jgi:hypothetical protein
MSKLPKAHRFIDISDYGRTPARWIANSLKETKATPIHVTLAFGIVGLLGCYFILTHHFILAGICLILKSVLDAADGELARVKKTPSYTGRYLDSIFDIILNFLILGCIWYITSGSLLIALLAFIGVQLQGTLFNYYYVILRNEFDGDDTSRINEKKAPTALPREKQIHVNILYQTFNVLYRVFDQAIYYADRKAPKKQYFPNWFMTAVSALGLGSQLLIIAAMLALNLEHYILPFFVAYTAAIPVLIFIRRWLNR